MTPSEEIGGLRIVQWTLSNKYYTADVDFAVVDATDWRLRHAVGVPAVVFVWAEGEVRRSNTVRLSRSWLITYRCA